MEQGWEIVSVHAPLDRFWLVQGLHGLPRTWHGLRHQSVTRSCNNERQHDDPSFR